MIADKERLLLKIFHDYYVRNMSQAEIAGRHFVSRQKVQRYLEQGRKENLVEVRVKFPDRMHGQLESELEDKYGLMEVNIADVDGDNPALVRRNIAEMASDYFIRVLKSDMTASIAWSSFVSDMLESAARKVESLREKPRDIHIVLTLGAVAGADPDLQTLDSARRMSGSLAAEIHLLLAPGMTTSSDAWRILMDDPQISEVVDKARHADASFFGVGSVDGDSKLINTLKKVMPDFYPKLRELGVVGDLNGHFFDRDGNSIASELDERLIGLNLDEIKALPMTVGITAGAGKYTAFRAALAGKIFKVVITDYDMARRLMAEK